MYRPDYWKNNFESVNGYCDRNKLYAVYTELLVFPLRLIPIMVSVVKLFKFQRKLFQCPHVYVEVRKYKELKWTEIRVI
jgi:hypothetical protein